MSNIYAKPIVNGKSSFTVSDEENDAVIKAMECNQEIRKKKNKNYQKGIDK
jgi:hypothetical protein